MKELTYNRTAAVAYARKWALSRNPAYYDFENVGGDCTNFASQCVFAGARVMNYKKDTGWYYFTSYDRAAAWSGAEYLCKFLTENSGKGPRGHIAPREEIEPGDLVQLGFGEGFRHTLVITSASPAILVCAHTGDALDVPLTEYGYSRKRFIHIDGVRA